MTNDAEIETRFWKALKSDRTLMIGLVGVEDGVGQPMTAQVGQEGRGMSGTNTGAAGVFPKTAPIAGLAFSHASDIRIFRWPGPLPCRRPDRGTVPAQFWWGVFAPGSRPLSERGCTG